MDAVYRFLTDQKLAVLSTINAASLRPESALVAFAETADLCIYFQTGRYTRKAQNLAVSPNVSFVFGLTEQDMETVQYEGTAELLENQSDIELCKQLFKHKKSPSTDAFMNRTAVAFYKVRPVWVGYSNYRGKSPIVLEITEFIS